MISPIIDEDLRKIVEARHHDPFAVLGKHKVGEQTVVRVHFPDCEGVTIAEGELPMKRVPGTDIFEWRGVTNQLPDRYRLIWRDKGHHEHVTHDPYAFPPQLSDFDLHLFGEGKHWHAYRI
jgi:1,4-alpha-glucan branching enzyme